MTKEAYNAYKKLEILGIELVSVEANIERLKQYDEDIYNHILECMKMAREMIKYKKDKL